MQQVYEPNSFLNENSIENDENDELSFLDQNISLENSSEIKYTSRRQIEIMLENKQLMSAINDTFEW